jgi:TetR/AcrR family transcriptional regulator, cholesterol catabolism regulator
MIDILPAMSAKISKNRESSSQTSKKLIEAAIDLFSRKGFKGTSIRDLAAEIGMTTSNIYHYFDTKEGLLAAIEQQTLEPITREFRRIASIDMPPLDRFVLLIRTHLAYLDVHRKESLIFSSLSEETFPPGRKDLNKKFQTETFFIYRSEIERLLSSIGMKKNSTILAFSTLGSIIWFLRWYRPDGGMTFDEVANAIIDYILSGITGNHQVTKRRSKK